MYFKNLPKDVQEAIKGLTKDAEFQKRFSSDPILDELDSEKLDIGECYAELCAILKHTFELDGKNFHYISPAPWSILWCLENPFVKKAKREPSEEDIDLFLWMTENGVQEFTLPQILSAAKGFCKKNNITKEEALQAIRLNIYYSFNPLHMFPATRAKLVGADEEPIYDADWLTGLVCKVHHTSGAEANYIMHEMPLTECFYYYIQYCRKELKMKLEKRTSEEILKAQAERTCELILDRLQELGVTKEEERKELFKIMTTPPGNDK